MEWIEADPLPVECRNCQEEDCYNCDNAGNRWKLTREDELRVRRKSLLKTIDRMKCQLQDIEREISSLRKEK